MSTCPWYPPKPEEIAVGNLISVDSSVPIYLESSPRARLVVASPHEIAAGFARRAPLRLLPLVLTRTPTAPPPINYNADLSACRSRNLVITQLPRCRLPTRSCQQKPRRAIP